MPYRLVTDGRTDGRTDTRRQHIYRACIASRCKNCQLWLHAPASDEARYSHAVCSDVLRYAAKRHNTKIILTRMNGRLNSGICAPIRTISHIRRRPPAAERWTVGSIVCVCVCGRMQSNWIYALVLSAPDEDIDEVERLPETGSCVCPRNSWDFAALASRASLQSETCLL